MISKEAREQIRVGVLGATDTNMTMDEAVDYIGEYAIPLIEKQVRREIGEWLREQFSKGIFLPIIAKGTANLMKGELPEQEGKG